MDSLMVNGSESSDPIEIREYIVQFYMQLYSKQYSWRPKLDGLSFHYIGDEEGSCLEREFESEVFELVQTLNGNKAPRPDGFSLGFFHGRWSIEKSIMLHSFLLSQRELVRWKLRTFVQ
jgi:hypothetical protein